MKMWLMLSLIVLLELSWRASGTATEVLDKVGKDLVVIIDGTGPHTDAFDRDPDLVKINDHLKSKDNTIVFCPDSSTTSKSDSPFSIDGFTRLFDRITGLGTLDNVLRSYIFLMDNFEEGDQIYLLGLNRGGDAVCFLEGLLNLVGLLNPNKGNLVQNALLAYQKAENRKRCYLKEKANHKWQKAFRLKEMEGRRISYVFHTYQPDLFLGAWNSCDSVVVPCRNCPSGVDVPKMRDEKNVEYFPNGDSHLQVQGFFRRGRSELSNRSNKDHLLWMLKKAQKKGLQIDQSLFDEITSLQVS